MKDRNIKDKNFIKRRKLNKSDQEGVAATVGTIMALLVFLSLLSLITQQYVPVWMEDKEAYHMDEAMMQFSQMKGSIDNLIMNDITDYPLYSYVRLGSEGVPMFASKTPGVFRMMQEIDGMVLVFNETVDGDTVTRRFHSTGSVSLEVLNRYFEQQTVIYEHGAILLEQRDRAVVRAPPPIGIEKHGNDFAIRLTMVDIIGAEENVDGTGSVGVTTELWSSSRRTVRGEVSDVTLSLSTRQPDAWVNWFENETDVEDSDIDVVDPGGGESLYKITITLDNVSEIRYTHAKVNMKLST